MQADNVPTAAELTKALRLEPRSPELAGLSSCTVAGPLRCQENSWLFKAALGARGPSLALKVCLDPVQHRPCPVTAAQELETLSRMCGYFAGNSRLGVPRPYPLLVDRGILVTEWIEGVQLSEMLTSPVNSSHRMKRPELVALAGSWLRFFHDFAPAEPGRLVTDAILISLHEALATASPAVRQDPLVQEAVNLLEVTANLIGRRSYPRALLHGDFKSDNLIVCGERLLGFDIALQHENVVLRDLAPFLNHLELIASPLRGLRLALEVRSLSAAFLRGYFEREKMLPVEAVAWLRLNSVLVVWMERNLRPRPRLKGWYSDWCFRRLTRFLCQELRNASTSTPRQHHLPRESC
ncbi:phosphotransferase family protein [Nitrococcus mobilis]|uniref:Aminoglycoside phosphotransferase domain-containing protein n=1 Tax=Nitrococcus mobilis Nb-231 TaxID=314278 RepID=A4BT67_9GAMM|nr:phosphotransferase [Nitrococcus mobilis]EAR21135.1 hypothetical protein NB231_08192 [Nitrococcus mobilis Nb-231]